MVSSTSFRWGSVRAVVAAVLMLLVALTSLVLGSTQARAAGLSGWDSMRAGIQKSTYLDLIFEDGKAVNRAQGGGDLINNGVSVSEDAELGRSVGSFSRSNGTHIAAPAYLPDWYQGFSQASTVSIVLKPGQVGGSYYNPIGNMERAGSGFELTPSGDGLKVEFWLHDSGTGDYVIPSAGSALPYDRWAMLTATHDGSTVKLYVNGEQVASESTTGSITLPPEGARKWFIGADISGSGGIQSAFNGNIAHAFVSPGVMSASDIATLAYQQLPGKDTVAPELRVDPNPAADHVTGEALKLPGAQSADDSGASALGVVVTDPNGAETIVQAARMTAPDFSPADFTPRTPGEYTVAYTARDFAGNETTQSVTFEVTGDEIADEPEEPVVRTDPEVPTETSPLRLGIISDTHNGSSKPTQNARLKTALEFLRDQSADRIMVVGDFTDGGSQGEYDVYQSIVDGVPDLPPVIESSGNHEGNTQQRFIDVTGEYPYTHRVVNGYHLITLSPGSGIVMERAEAELPEGFISQGTATSLGGGNYVHTRLWLEKQLKLAEADGPDKPIFVFFHHPVKDTFYVSEEWNGSGLVGAFDNHPTVVSFSGHIHSPNMHPRSIYQSEKGWTAVNTVSLSYYELERGMVYGSVPPGAEKCAQGLVLDVDGTEVTIKNYDFISGQWIDQTWTFDTAAGKERPYTDARYDLAKAPIWADGSEVTVSDITETGARFTFPQALVDPVSIDDDIVHSYRYVVTEKESGRVADEFRTWSEFYFLPMRETMSYHTNKLKSGIEYTISITAFDAYKKESETAITADFTTGGDVVIEELTWDEMREGVPAGTYIDAIAQDGRIVNRAGSGPQLFSPAGNDDNGSTFETEEELGREVMVFAGQPEQTYTHDHYTPLEYTQLNSKQTLSITVKTPAITGGYLNPLGNMQGSGSGFELTRAGEKIKAEYWTHVGGGYKVPGTSDATHLEPDTWYVITGVFDGVSTKLFVNGELIDQKDAFGSITLPPEGARRFYIGADTTTSGQPESPYRGSMAHALVSGIALTNDQVAMHARQQLASLDTTGPEVRLDSEIAAESVAGGTIELPGAKTADDSGISRFDPVTVVGPDGEEIVVQNTSTDPADFAAATFDVSEDGAGEYTITYTAKDEAGNVTAVSHVVVVTEASTEPTEPEQPTDPEQPQEPTDPVDPDEPTVPVDPSDPTDPSTPADPSLPTDPTTPEDPQVPAPELPGAPAGSSDGGPTTGGTEAPAGSKTTTKVPKTGDETAQPHVLLALALGGVVLVGTSIVIMRRRVR